MAARLGSQWPPRGPLTTAYTVTHPSGLECYLSDRSFRPTPISTILVDPTDSDRLYAFTDFLGLVISEDRGDSWFFLSEGLPTGLTLAAAALPTEPGHLIAGFNGTGVFATEDQGLNWILSSEGMNAATVRAIAVSPMDDETVWTALDSGGLFKSTDRGETWMESRAGFLNRGSVTFEVDPQDPNRLYVGSVDPSNFTTGGLARSEDGGSSWTQVPSSRDYRALAVNPTDGRFVLAGGTSNFFRGRDGFIWSQDYGETFSFSFFREFAAYNVLDLTYDTSNPATVWTIANTVGVWSIWSSGNGGVSYFGPFFSSPVPYLHVEVDPTDSERVYLTTDGAGFIRSIPGESFRGANEGLPNGGLVSVLSLAISPDTPSNLLIATNFGVFRSSNHGGNWELTEVGLPARGVRQVIFGTGGTAYAATRSTGLYVSTDSGMTWSPTGSTPLTEAGIVHGANFRRGSLAPGQIGSIFGGPFTDLLELATAIPLPTSLAGVVVKVMDAAGSEREAALFFASPGQVNFEVPGASVPGAGTLTVCFKDGSEASVPIEIAAVNPGLFASAGTGEGPAAASAVRIGPGGEQTPVTVTNFVDGEHRTVPIAVGDGQDPIVLVLFGSGMRGFSSVQAFVDGQEVVVFALVAQSVFVGLDQVNIDLPESLAGAGVVEVYLLVDGVRTNSVLVEVE